MPKVSPEYRAERRAHILAAARRCFVRDGFHGTSMQDLVDEAGVSSGAVYRYFSSKEAVIEAIAAENLDEVVGVIEKSVEEGLTAEATIAAVLEFVTARHSEDGFAAIALLVWSEAMRNPTLAQRLRDSIGAATRLLRSSKRPGHDEAVATDLLLCVLPGYLMQLALRGPPAVKHLPRTVESVFARHSSHANSGHQSHDRRS
ncbi:TetR/AcrR family transcriptional regulator [Mycobacterium noviomagense]|uniref:TetR family transcriptional regulator n=1 Tax=Mycobacterium noviomagense TaxID=459858 RepID=A0A7I7P947_9MYCO|nr:TetR/AcrR family transcriptional regulator [Mycobacterium noviomagense]ORB18276.1 TetR family transcriptional regulator [Mycobacterium noviomagense]BBY05102.1 TetR family transcriptional regulator [Mycobacterium noviomagense]